jgi:hypothetical protein
MPDKTYDCAATTCKPAKTKAIIDKNDFSIGYNLEYKFNVLMYRRL